MILTGPKIQEEVNKEVITIEPFKPDQLNPNSYDFRLGNTLKIYKNKILDTREPNETETIIIPEEGYIIRPDTLYLGHTEEVFGSDFYVPIVRGKSSTGRVGLFVHITADLIDIGYHGQYTLMLHSVQPVKVYPGMKIGQVTFWKTFGDIVLYKGKYQGSQGPSESQVYKDFPQTEKEPPKETATSDQVSIVRRIFYGLMNRDRIGSPKKIKILTGVDIPFVPFGGSPIICNDWYSDLPDDVEVRFLTMPPNDPKYGHWWTMKDVVFLNTEKKRSVEEFPSYIEQLKEEVAKQIESFKPDIIHCQHLNFGLSRAFVEVDSSIPKIGICHGTDVQIATRSDFFLENMKYIRKGLNLLHFPAQKMADDYFKVDPCDTPHVIIPHGVSDSAFKKQKTRTYQNSDGLLKILYAGRLTSYKGADIVVEAMKYLDDNFHLTIIGGEDEQGYKQKMLDETGRSGTENRVNFMDHMRQDKLWEKMLEFDVMVFPPRTLEAFSLSTIEAQAMGIPIIYAGAGGIENAVGDSGIRIKENTPEEWANQLRFVRENPEILSQYQKTGFTNAEKHRLSKIKSTFFQTSRNLIEKFRA